MTTLPVEKCFGARVPGRFAQNLYIPEKLTPLVVHARLPGTLESLNATRYNQLTGLILPRATQLF